MKKSKQGQDLPFDARLHPAIFKEEALSAFADLRNQASDVPEMTLDEINEEIAAARAERKTSMA